MDRRFYSSGGVFLFVFLLSLSFFLFSFWNGNEKNENEKESSELKKGKTVIFSFFDQEIFHDIGGEFTVIGGEVPLGSTVFFRTKENDEWTEMKPESEEDAPDFQAPKENTVFLELVFLEPSKYFSFRIEGQNDQDKEVSFFFIDARESEKRSLSFFAEASDQKRDSAFFEQNAIIPRSEWGANESFRYLSETASSPTPSQTFDSDYQKDPPPKSQKVLECEKLQQLYPEEFTYSSVEYQENGKKLRWRYEYSSKIEKIIIHHTAENGVGNGRDPKEVMRAIYSYHANSRGWGDIGYNFVIDPYGNIYEGRSGGDYVVGGHVYCANTHTMGVALMGNFENEDPSELQLLALETFLPTLASKYNLDLTVSSVFHGKLSNNLLGHRDLGATACPGKNMYELLSQIIDNIAIGGSSFFKEIQKPNTNTNVVLAATALGSVDLVSIGPGEQKNISLKFRNMGNTAWDKKTTWLYGVLPGKDVSIIPPKGMQSYVSGVLRENMVLPGSTGTFDITLVGGNRGGLSTVEFSPFVGAQKIEKASIVVPVQTVSASYKFTEKEVIFSPQLPKKDTPVSVSIALANTGNVIWRKGEVSLDVLSSRTRQRFSLQMKEDTIGQHGIAHFVGIIGPFPKNGRMPMVFRLNSESGSTPGATSFRRVININGVATDSAMFTISEGKLLYRESSPKNSIPKRIFIVKNTGDMLWDKNTVQLKVSGVGNNSFISMNEEKVHPGQNASFLVSLQNPLTRSSRLKLQITSSKKPIKGGNLSWIIVPKSNQVVSINPTYEPTPTPNIQPAPNGSIDEAVIRVRLGFSDDSATILSEHAENFRLFVDGKFLSSGTQALLSADTNSISLSGKTADIVRIIPSEGDILRIVSWERRPSWNQNLNDNAFRGILEFRTENGELYVINELPMKDYLKGLAEVSDSAPIEKQKAIAVVARTYAAYYLSADNRKYPGAPYDGNDSPDSFQKYLGYGYEQRSPKFTKAVSDTQNEVVTYKGKLIKTPFFSESNGKTKSAEEVWGWKDTPYLLSVEDSYCKQGKGIQAGHGVGLSGCGSEGMANVGKNYLEILKYYYTGIEVEKR
jgi:hypothetical protein